MKIKSSQLNQGVENHKNCDDFMYCKNDKEIQKTKSEIEEDKFVDDFARAIVLIVKSKTLNN